MDTTPRKTRRLLVVDDERIQRMIIVRAVAAVDFAADTAATLEEAFACLADYAYDAVILDLSLGETEGISLLQALRDSAADPVVIFISRLDHRVRIASARLAAAFGLRVGGALQKPVNPTALRTMLLEAPARAEAPHERSVSIPTAEELSRAIQSGALVTHFQPKVSLLDGRVVGLEALARWPRDNDVSIPPDVFIPLAERSNLIVPLTMLVLRQSLETCRRWRDLNPACSVAVNFSPLVLPHPTLLDDIEHALHENGLGPGALVAEITESTVIANPLVAAEVLTRLRIKGISLSIDDFGTGHSSLLSLLRLPFSELKIDRSFIANCDSDPEAWKIVRATVSMARELGMTVVAEGIESAAIASRLRDIGCDTGQGWYFGRPMAAEVLLQWFDQRAAVPA